MALQSVISEDAWAQPLLWVVKDRWSRSAHLLDYEIAAGDTALCGRPFGEIAWQVGERPRSVCRQCQERSPAHEAREWQRRAVDQAARRVQTESERWLSVPLGWLWPNERSPILCFALTSQRQTGSCHSIGMCATLVLGSPIISTINGRILTMPCAAGRSVRSSAKAKNDLVPCVRHVKTALTATRSIGGNAEQPSSRRQEGRQRLRSASFFAPKPQESLAGRPSPNDQVEANARLRILAAERLSAAKDQAGPRRTSWPWEAAMITLGAARTRGS